MVGLPLTIYDPEEEHLPYFKAYFLEVAQIRAYLNRHPAVGLVLIGHSDERANYIDSEYRGLLYADEVQSDIDDHGLPGISTENDQSGQGETTGSRTYPRGVGEESSGGDRPGIDQRFPAWRK